MHTTGLLLNFVNVVVCLGVAFAAVCRLAAMHRTDPLAPGLVFLGLFVGAILAGGRFWLFGSPAGWPDVILAGACLGVLTVTAARKRGRATCNV